jgi:hypothetical protein
MASLLFGGSTAPEEAGPAAHQLAGRPSGLADQTLPGVKLLIKRRPPRPIHFTSVPNNFQAGTFDKPFLRLPKRLDD